MLSNKSFTAEQGMQSLIRWRIVGNLSTRYQQDATKRQFEGAGCVISSMVLRWQVRNNQNRKPVSGIMICSI